MSERSLGLIPTTSNFFYINSGWLVPQKVTIYCGEPFYVHIVLPHEVLLCSVLYVQVILHRVVFFQCFYIESLYILLHNLIYSYENLFKNGWGEVSQTVLLEEITLSIK